MVIVVVGCMVSGEQRRLLQTDVQNAIRDGGLVSDGFYLCSQFVVAKMKHRRSSRCSAEAP